jgi:hypothetical protein
MSTLKFYTWLQLGVSNPNSHTDSVFTWQPEPGLYVQIHLQIARPTLAFVCASTDPRELPRDLNDEMMYDGPSLHLSELDAMLSMPLTLDAARAAIRSADKIVVEDDYDYYTEQEADTYFEKDGRRRNITLYSETKNSGPRVFPTDLVIENTVKALEAFFANSR